MDKLPRVYGYFNSMMVQLKQNFNTIWTHWITEFQFHDGTIKTTMFIPITESVNKFQFHDGTIKTIVSTVSGTSYM